MTEVNYSSTDISAQEPTQQEASEAVGLPSAIDPSLLAAKPPAQTRARDRVFGIENLTDKRYWKESPYQYGHVYLFPGAPRTLRLAVTAAL
jgi:hypothetical protein